MGNTVPPATRRQDVRSVRDDADPASIAAAPAGRRRPAAALRWAALLALSVVCVGLLRAAQVPAALLLGTMIAGVAVAVTQGSLALPRWSFVLAQSVVGALIASRFSPPVARSVVVSWKLYVLLTVAVLGVSTVMGWLLARWRLLPGTTGVWGLSPGAATAMIVMAEAYGADMRVVAFMQYLRVGVVTVLASAFSHHAAGASPPWFGALDGARFGQTLALLVGGAVLGRLSRIPAGALVVTFALGSGLNAAGLLEPELPLWLLAASYGIVGWTVGLRFTRDILVYTARAAPRILGAILVLVAICAGLAVALARVEGIDLLVAYLATSPGGADTIAIIAASTGRADMAFAMAMQMVRTMVVTFLGPAIARFVANRVDGPPAA